MMNPLNLHPGNVLLIASMVVIFNLLGEEGYFEGDEIKTYFNELYTKWKVNKCRKIKERAKKKGVMNRG